MSGNMFENRPNFVAPLEFPLDFFFFAGSGTGFDFTVTARLNHAFKSGLAHRNSAPDGAGSADALLATSPDGKLAVRTRRSPGGGSDNMSSRSLTKS